MRIAFAHDSVELKSWGLEAEMADYVSACEEGYLILGEGARQRHDFFSVRIRLGFPGTSSFGIGVVSEGHGLVPQLLLLPEREQLLLGVNQEVTCVSIKDRRLIFRVDLGWLFHSFLELKQHGIVLIFHEIGVTAIDEIGNQRWTFTRDIIQSCIVAHSKIELQFLDEAPVRLSLVTGQELSA
jgi:hypothetical protein